MSGVLKSTKKVFKKVTKVVKKIAPIALAAAAIYFTAGAALGGAGWGATVGAAVRGMAGTGVLADVLAGAVTQAGFGAVLGGAIGAVTGKGILKGAQYGALGGAVTGGATGAFGMGANLPSNLGGVQADLPSNLAIPPAVLNAGGDNLSMAGALDQAAVSPVRVPTNNLGSGGGGGGTGFWSSDFANSPVAGGLVLGAGQGLVALASTLGDDAGDISREERDAIRANYSGTKGLLTSYNAPVQPQTPTERFDANYPTGAFKYDPSVGQIVRIG